MTVNAMICDDEDQCREEIAKYLLKYCDEHNISCRFDSFVSGEDALTSDNTYNIAFLDVEIGSITGIEIAEHLRKRKKNIIIFFITAYDKYIDDAMNLFALRFLKKPLDYSRFFSGLDRAIDLINEDIVEIFLYNDQKHIKINSQAIMYIETLNHKTKIVTPEKTYYSSQLIDHWEKTLTHTSFVRTHKSYILNMDYVFEYQRGEVKLSNGEIVPISYRNQSEFRRIFYNYLKRRK